MNELQVFNFEQGTHEWFEARKGIPTASNFDAIMSKGRGGGKSQKRQTYMMKLLAERLLDDITSIGTNEHMERGHEMEPIARSAYEYETEAVVNQVGFMRMGDMGYSPDGLIGDDGLLEIKSKLPHLHLAVCIADVVPKEHIHQVNGGMLVSGRSWHDFMSYCPGLRPFIKRVHRDENTMIEMKKAIDEFNFELDVLYHKMSGA